MEERPWEDAASADRLVVVDEAGETTNTTTSSSAMAKKKETMAFREPRTGERTRTVAGRTPGTQSPLGSVGVDEGQTVRTIGNKNAQAASHHMQHNEKVTGVRKNSITGSRLDGEAAETEKGREEEFAHHRSAVRGVPHHHLPNHNAQYQRGERTSDESTSHPRSRSPNLNTVTDAVGEREERPTTIQNSSSNQQEKNDTFIPFSEQQHQHQQEVLYWEDINDNNNNNNNIDTSEASTSTHRINNSVAEGFENSNLILRSPHSDAITTQPTLLPEDDAPVAATGQQHDWPDHHPERERKPPSLEGPTGGSQAETPADSQTTIATTTTRSDSNVSQPTSRTTGGNPTGGSPPGREQQQGELSPGLATRMGYAATSMGRHYSNQHHLPPSNPWNVGGAQRQGGSGGGIIDADEAEEDKIIMESGISNEQHLLEDSLLVDDDYDDYDEEDAVEVCSHEGKRRETDDDTTVQSLDSVTVSSPAIAPLPADGGGGGPEDSNPAASAAAATAATAQVRAHHRRHGSGSGSSGLYLPGGMFQQQQQQGRVAGIGLQQPVLPAVETPSTVSTAASTDEASPAGDNNNLQQSSIERSLLLGAGDQQQMQMQQQQHLPPPGPGVYLPHHHQLQPQPQQHHQRIPSWEASPRNQHLFHPDEQQQQQQQQQGFHTLPPAFVPQQQQQQHSQWGQQQQQPQPPQQMVTSFRGGSGGGEHHFHDPSYAQYAGSPLTPGAAGYQHAPQQAPQQAHRFPPPQLPFLPGRGTPPIDNRVHHHPRPGPGQGGGFDPYQQRKPVGAAAAAAAAAAAYPHQGGPRLTVATGGGTTTTPPRTPRGGGRGMPPSTPSPHRGSHGGSFGASAQAGQQSGGGGGGGGGGSRSSSEILKTLLRKKACLYEPDTSRAVALVTWLVGRELALEHGFFSRQQLQAGVHACVADKINSGSITRTKVNRCMQIILNSCFHYIIPRPDGTEENGDSFRLHFAREAEDDSFLLRMLPDPWNDVAVDKAEVLRVSENEPETSKSKKGAGPDTTPQSSPRLDGVSPDKGSPGRDSERGDDDDNQKRAVLLCFNENVRRAEDVFRCHNEFIRDTAHASHLQLSSQEWRLFFGPEAAVAPYIWGNIGIPVPYSEIHGSSHVDALGMMTTYEAGKFRTSWCTKRYDHDHELCGFAHAEVNGGWLRRNPSVRQYRDEMCPSVTTVTDKNMGQSLFVLNECPHGVNCEFAHSIEEVKYHPRRYKMSACASVGRPGGCNLGDVCPSFHPVDAYRFPKKSDGRSSRHSRYSHHQPSGGGSKGNTGPPPASPLLLASPAPISSFEEHLLLPGLKNLYRRQCAVVRAHLRKGGCTCYYSYFGDDNGCCSATNPRPAGVTKPSRGLPNPTRGH